MPLGLFLFFSWSLAPDLQFSLGQTNLRRKLPLYLWARILSDRNIFCTLWEGRITAGSNAPGAFLVFCWSLAPDSRFSLCQTNIRRKVWTRILSNRKIFLYHEGRGLMPLGLFLFFFWGGGSLVLVMRFCLGQHSQLKLPDYVTQGKQNLSITQHTNNVPQICQRSILIW